VYYATHSGLSYSRSFVQSLVLIAVVVSMVMMVIGNSLVIAAGMMGGLAIIRFRNVLKDTRDMAYVFSVLVVGMAAGSQRYLTAVLGTAVLCMIAIYLHLTSFGSHEPKNGFLRFHLSSGLGPDHPVLVVFKRHCSDFQLLSVQDAGPGAGSDCAYQIMVRRPSEGEAFVGELEKVPGVSQVSLTMQEELLEV